MMATSRPPHMCREHPAGTVACYKRHGCRCAGCTNANSRYVKGRRHDLDAGRSRRVDATPVRIHLARLAAAGMTQAQIATESGVVHSTIWRITQGRATVTRDTAARIYTVRPAPVVQVTAGLVDGCGTRLRIRALHAIGWDYQALGQAMGCGHSRLVQRWASTVTVSASTRARVAHAYDALWDQPRDTFGGRRAIARAARAGWVTPMALDDDRIDQPGYQPATLADPRSMVDRVADVVALGLDLPEAAARLGVRRDSIRTACSRAGELDLWEVLVERERRTA